jgi:diadenosine tetraphosphate (Ap4A) HIT family hydrolase
VSNVVAQRRTWPSDWERRKAGDNCPLCEEGRPEINAYGSHRVYAGAYSDAYLRQLVAPRGYTLVVWRGRHVSEPTELSSDEATGYWLEVLQVARAIEQLYSPAKLNLQILGNAVPHLHTHVVPRYVDDPNPEFPPAFVHEVTEMLPSDVYELEASELARVILASA